MELHQRARWIDAGFARVDLEQPQKLVDGSLPHPGSERNFAARALAGGWI